MTRTPERHLAHFNVLDALRAAKACPLCLLEAECARRYFASLLHEYVNDPEIRGELKQTKGYCARHARRLLNQGDGFGTAILYRDQVELFRSFLRVLQSSSHRDLLRADLAWWRGGEPCPACRAEVRDRERYIAVLLSGLHDEEMRLAFDTSPVLCVPHFAAVLHAARDAHVQSYLIEVQSQKFTCLLHDLDEFCRKHDYRFCQEGMGAEGDSWRRAVAAMVGNADVF